MHAQIVGWSIVLAIAVAALLWLIAVGLPDAMEERDRESCADLMAMYDREEDDEMADALLQMYNANCRSR